MMASTFEPSHAAVFDASIRTWVDNAKTPVNIEKLKKRKEKNEGDKPSKRSVSNRLSTALLLLPL